LQRATSRQDFWPTLIFAASCLFVLDVFNRRVLVSFGWVGAAFARLKKLVFRHDGAQPAVAVSLARLQQRKSELGIEFDSRRAAVRFEPSPDDAELPSLERELVASAGQARPARAATLDMAPQAEEEDYTARLLKAKQRARNERRTGDITQE
jgi:hypothetical protein